MTSLSSRVAAVIVTLFLALAPAFATAQSTSTASAQSGVGPANTTTRSTRHTVFGVRRAWIGVAVVVLVVVVGLVVMSGNRSTTPTIRRE